VNPANQHPLLDLPLMTAARIAALESRAAAILGTGGDVVVFGAEAELPLEAVTASLGGPSLVWLNVVTSPYGRIFGEMLRARGSTVHELTPPSDRPVRVKDVQDALERRPEIAALAIVHAEALTGIVNPLAEVLALAGPRGVLTVVDAVASAGAEPLAVDALGIDLCVIGPQKGWGGPAGASVVTVSDRAWAAMRANPVSLRGSALSLLDVKEQWLDTGRARVRGTPPPLELSALEAALDRLEAEGIEAVVERHRCAGRAARAGVRALGLSPWVADERHACCVATSVRLPAGIEPDVVVARLAQGYGVDTTPGSGPLAGAALRLDHMGPRAGFAYVAAAVIGLGAVLRELGAEIDLAAGAEAMAASFVAWPREAPDSSPQGQRPLVGAATHCDDVG
jgi:aspartate aminotransferase-like enzyme